MKDKILVGLYFLLLALLTRNCILPIFFTEYMGGLHGDVGLYVYQLTKGIPFMFSKGFMEGPLFYPFGKTAAFTDNFLFPSVLGFILTSLGLNDPTAWNAVFILSVWLTGFGTFLLTMQIGGSAFSGILAGTLFQGMSFFMAHTGHAQLQWIGFLPLSLTYLFRSNLSPTFAHGLTLGVLLVTTFCSSVYYAIFLSIIYAFGMPYVFMKTLSWKWTGGIAAGTLLIIPFALPYLDVQRELGDRSFNDLFTFRASLSSYLSASPISYLYGGQLFESSFETQLFPGFLTYFGLLIFLLLNINAFTGVFLAFILSIPLSPILGLIIFPLLVFLLYRSKDASSFQKNFLLFVTGLFFCFTFAQRFPSLCSVFYEYFPGFSGVRAVGRFGLVSVFCICALGSSVLSFRSKYVQIPLLILALVETYPHQQQFSSEPPVETLPLGKEDVFISLPFETSQKNRSLNDFSNKIIGLQNQLFPGARMVNGYSGINPIWFLDLQRTLSSFPSEGSFKRMGQIVGLNHILVDRSVPSFSAPPSAHLKVATIDKTRGTLYKFSYHHSCGSPIKIITPPRLTRLPLCYKTKVPFVLEGSLSKKQKIRPQLFKPGFNVSQRVLYLPKSRRNISPKAFKITCKGDKETEILFSRCEFGDSL